MIESNYKYAGLKQEDMNIKDEPRIKKKKKKKGDKREAVVPSGYSRINLSIMSSERENSLGEGPR